MSSGANAPQQWTGASVGSSSKDAAWTGASDVVEDFNIGDMVFMLNPFFKDGTRLRTRPDRDAPFTDEHVLNDAQVEVLEKSEADFVLIRCEEQDIVEGWVRSRNLTHVARATGLKSTKPSGRQLNRSKTISNLEVDRTADEQKRLETDAADDKATSIKQLMAARGEDTNEKSFHQSNAIRKQLHKKRRGTLDPQSKQMARWDTCTTLALLFTATVTPFEVCILEVCTAAGSNIL